MEKQTLREARITPFRSKPDTNLFSHLVLATFWLSPGKSGLVLPNRTIPLICQHPFGMFFQLYSWTARSWAGCKVRKSVQLSLGAPQSELSTRVFLQALWGPNNLRQRRGSLSTERGTAHLCSRDSAASGRKETLSDWLTTELFLSVLSLQECFMCRPIGSLQECDHCNTV